MSQEGEAEQPSGEHVVHHVREMLYASITGVATLLALYVHAENLTGRAAAASLATTMGGLFLASLVADTLAYAHAGSGAPKPSVLRRILSVAGRALEVAVVPGVILLLADAGLWSVRTAIIIAVVVLSVTQFILVLLGLRGAGSTPAQKLWYLLLQAAAIVAVVLFKVLVK
ncbi:hypothetical protein [Granulicoccus phenolivorans]|uniref:hypothetical protein n=1 Tax=Granulicoccus phenolivorans TaxID=266854 RepID=UPI0004031D3A|nr:hypothetical protein [Granulicoccus phenolivorans]